MCSSWALGQDLSSDTRLSCNGLNAVLRCRPAAAAPNATYDAEEGLSFETSESIKPTTSFEAMGLKEPLLRGVYQFGFEKPSAIQQRAIAPIVQGRDVIAQAQSGTGKTSMIAVSLLQLLDSQNFE